MKINRKWKDRLFIRIFSDPEHLLELYNAINGTSYDDPAQLEITTLETVVYLSMKNDASFVIDDELQLWEHQSTCNCNMPVRGFIYLASLYQQYIKRHKINIYSSRLKKLPMPQYIVFYNGQKDEPERRVLRLSDAFIRRERDEDKEPCLELRAVVLNINYGKNRELMERCRRLREYAQFVAKVRELQEDGQPMEETVSRAVQYCIDHDILEDFLSSHKAEVIDMFLTEYNEAEHMQMEREEWREEGREEGLKEGREVNLIGVIRRLLAKGVSEEAAAELLDEEPQHVNRISRAVSAHPEWTDAEVYGSFCENK